MESIRIAGHRPRARVEHALQPYSLRLRCRAHRVESGIDDGGEIDRADIQTHLPRDDPRHIEEVVDQLHLRVGVAIDGLERSGRRGFVELPGSLKIGQYTPGTHIPIVDESTLYERQPPNALVLSWHIGEAIVPKIRERGFRGRFIVPLPEPRTI